MNIKKVLFQHTHPDYHPNYYLVYFAFGATSRGKLRSEFGKVAKHDRSRYAAHRVIDFDLTNMIENIVYTPSETLVEGIIERIWLEGTTLHVDLHDTTELFTEFVLDNITKDIDMRDSRYNRTYRRKTDVDRTIIFPPPETANEWKDRMLRTLSHCAHNFEKTLGELTPQIYTHSQNFATAHLTSNMLDRITNTGLHARLNIGYLWHQVLAAVGNAPNKPSKSDVESDVGVVYQNMKSPEQIKMFFHNHDVETWKKLRFSSGDNRNNHRRIHLWQSDFTPGKLLFDINAKHTTNGELHELNAKAELHRCATEDYGLAAVSPNWELITERIY